MPEVTFLGAPEGDATNVVQVDDVELKPDGEPRKVSASQLERLRALPGLQDAFEESNKNAKEG